jgi:hypothetical protein
MTPAPRKKFISLPGRKINIPQKGLFHGGRNFREIRAWPVSDTAQISKEVTVPFHRCCLALQISYPALVVRRRPYIP